MCLNINFKKYPHKHQKAYYFFQNIFWKDKEKTKFTNKWYD